MAFIIKCKQCGKEFVRTHNSQCYCSTDCFKEGRRIRYNERVKKQTISLKQPSVTIYDMMEIALQLSKKEGRTVQYGEVQEMLTLGKIELKGGVVNG